jgi:hypothetical protein
MAWRKVAYNLFYPTKLSFNQKLGIVIYDCNPSTLGQRNEGFEFEVSLVNSRTALATK